MSLLIALIHTFHDQALNNSISSSFYHSLAQLTSGYHLHLDQFASVVDFMMAICFREQSMEKLQVWCVRACMRACVCVCMRAFVCVCVCVCVSCECMLVCAYMRVLMFISVRMCIC